MTHPLDNLTDEEAQTLQLLVATRGPIPDALLPTVMAAIKAEIKAQKIVAAAKIEHDKTCHCDPKYLMSCPNMASAILLQGRKQPTMPIEPPPPPARFEENPEESQPESSEKAWYEEPSDGLYRKYSVIRLNDPDGKHHDCPFFVLDPAHDPFAWFALALYMTSCRETRPQLASDLQNILDNTDPGDTPDPPSPPARSRKEQYHYDWHSQTTPMADCVYPQCRGN